MTGRLLTLEEGPKLLAVQCKLAIPRPGMRYDLPVCSDQEQGNTRI